MLSKNELLRQCKLVWIVHHKPGDITAMPFLYTILCIMVRLMNYVTIKKRLIPLKVSMLNYDIISSV